MGKYFAAFELRLSRPLPRVKGSKPLVLLWLCVGLFYVQGCSRGVVQGSAGPAWVHGAGTHLCSTLCRWRLVVQWLCRVCRVLGSPGLSLICELMLKHSLIKGHQPSPAGRGKNYLWFGVLQCFRLRQVFCQVIWMLSLDHSVCRVPLEKMDMTSVRTNCPAHKR